MYKIEKIDEKFLLELIEKYKFNGNEFEFLVHFELNSDNLFLKSINIGHINPQPQETSIGFIKNPKNKTLRFLIDENLNFEYEGFEIVIDDYMCEMIRHPYRRFYRFDKGGELNAIYINFEHEINVTRDVPDLKMIYYRVPIDVSKPVAYYWELHNYPYHIKYIRLNTGLSLDYQYMMKYINQMFSICELGHLISIKDRNSVSLYFNCDDLIEKYNLKTKKKN